MAQCNEGGQAACLCAKVLYGKCTTAVAVSTHPQHCASSRKSTPKAQYYATFPRRLVLVPPLCHPKHSQAVAHGHTQVPLVERNQRTQPVQHLATYAGDPEHTAHPHTRTRVRTCACGHAPVDDVVRLPEDLCQAKVGQLGLEAERLGVVALEQHVLRLNVAMNELEVVQVLDGLRHLNQYLHDARDLGGDAVVVKARVEHSTLHRVPQRLPVAVFHHQDIARCDGGVLIRTQPPEAQVEAAWLTRGLLSRHRRPAVCGVRITCILHHVGQAAVHLRTTTMSGNKRFRRQQRHDVQSRPIRVCAPGLLLLLFAAG
eukprot:355739-Chlamydomonas_euryale.AAC.2